MVSCKTQGIKRGWRSNIKGLNQTDYVKKRKENDPHETWYGMYLVGIT